ncbi:trypsin-1-like [Arctopsyche grandis]|uniref:trypsin-1-like n=1 Tax=Arctopsyche grandis TaxID=121162 RepID=UPI00406D9A2F
MFRFLVVTFLFATAYGGVLPEVPQFAMDWVRDGRIVGGENADIKDAPYQVAMLYGITSFSQSCGGSIISPTVVVCAAHCPDGTTAARWKVRAGSTNSGSGGQVMDVSRMIMHSSYSGSTIDYDISLYILSSAINIDGVSTKAIPLPAQDATVADGAPAFVTGWGSTREGGSTVATLQKVTIPIVNQQTCVSAYTGFNSITARMICAGNLANGGQDACQGDSGGPLAVNGVLIGITSWGRGCARAGYPGVWTRVPSVRNWIDQQLALL